MSCHFSFHMLYRFIMNYWKLRVSLKTDTTESWGKNERAFRRDSRLTIAIGILKRFKYDCICYLLVRFLI